MNQIDHILIQRKHSSDLRDVRCQRGVNVDSDHHLVTAKIQARISMNKMHRGQRVQKYNVQTLENKEVQQAFRNKIIDFFFKFRHPCCVGYIKNGASGRVNPQLK